jgi:anti-sigma factor RsiW
MRTDHITLLLEEKPISRLSADELAAVESHAADCNDCQRAYKAAQVAGSLIEARAAERAEVSPFFNTRVMAAIREKRLSPQLPAWLRWWQAAGSLILMMSMLVVVLVGVTVFTAQPNWPVQSPEATVSRSIYSADDVVLDQDDLNDDTMPYDQVMGTVYDTESDDGN